MRKRQANTPPLKQSINPCCGTLIKNIVHFSWRLRHILGTQEQHTVSKRNRGRPTSLFLVKQVRHNQIIRKWCTNRWQINKLKSFVFGRASGQQLTQIFLSSNKKKIPNWWTPVNKQRKLIKLLNERMSIVNIDSASQYRWWFELLLHWI